MDRRGASFLRASHLVCYWDVDAFVIYNYASRIGVKASPVVAQVLDTCGRWRSFEQIEKCLPGYDPGSLRAVLDQMVDRSLLRRSDTGRAGVERNAGWSSWHPAAGFFHFSTKNVRFPRSPKEAARVWRLRGPSSPPPPPTKSYPRAAKLALPGAKNGGEFHAVLCSRRTWREFSAKPMTLADLATVLRLTWGVQRWGRTSEGRIALKTSPSGGARHAGEVYVLALRVAGLGRGLYHYAADRHRLVRLRSGATVRDVAAYLPGQPWFRSAAALLLMTAVFPREQWRYNFSRAYRAVLLDAGHLCQTFCLVATWLGLAPFCSIAFPDSRIERDIGIDGVSESMLYVAGVGRQPEHGWRPWRATE